MTTTIADVTRSDPGRGDKNAPYGCNSDRSYIETKLRECVSAFAVWETALRRTDHHLYKALGTLYVLLNDASIEHAQLRELACERAIRVRRGCDASIVLTRLVFSEDRRKASKYAGALKFLQLRSVPPDVDTVVDYLKEAGGLERCLNTFRQESLSNLAASRMYVRHKPIDASGLVTTFPWQDPPLGLNLEDVKGSHFILVGVRSETGQLRLMHQVVQDDGLLRKIMNIMARSSGLEPLRRHGELLS